MKLGKVPPAMRAVIERWTASRKPTRLSFVPNDGVLDLKLDGTLIGSIWIEDGELHLHPVRLMMISKQELKNLVSKIMESFE